ncbi:MAG TPA: endonuclease domain-containing protein [Pirellulaceae bacterium]
MGEHLERRRELRQRSTKAESLLWTAMRNRKMGGLKFRRQHSIGHYIADFACLEIKLVIEVDGDYHEHVAPSDNIRQRFFESEGFRVLRFTNDDVIADVDAVLVAVQRFLGCTPVGWLDPKTPHPSLLPMKHGEKGLKK